MGFVPDTTLPLHSNSTSRLPTAATASNYLLCVCFMRDPCLDTVFRTEHAMLSRPPRMTAWQASGLLRALSSIVRLFHRRGGLNAAQSDVGMPLPHFDRPYRMLSAPAAFSDPTTFSAAATSGLLQRTQAKRCPHRRQTTRRPPELLYQSAGDIGGESNCSTITC